jgi:hypothetical protein
LKNQPFCFAWCFYATQAMWFSEIFWTLPWCSMQCHISDSQKCACPIRDVDEIQFGGLPWPFQGRKLVQKPGTKFFLCQALCTHHGGFAFAICW